MTYTITPIFATPDVLYALYRGDGQFVKEFYDMHSAELAACHLDAIADDPGGPEPPGDDVPGPGDPLPPAVCEKCNRPRKTLTRYTYGWWCGTCISRYERHQNVQDRYGHGRRGY